MKISIITPCRNAEQYISDTIESVISQQGDFEIEYIIVDGASTDLTCKIAGQYLEKINKKKIPIHCHSVTMKLISEKDEGMYDALVKGLKQISGDIAAYLNADDFYQPNTFAVLTELFGHLPGLNWLTGVPTLYNHQRIIIESDWPFIYDNNFIQKGLYNNRTLPFIQQESVFFRLKILDSLDFERLKELKYAGDAFLWNCFAKKYPLFIVSAVLSGYRIHSGNLAVSTGNLYTCEMNSLQEYAILSEDEYNYLFFLYYTWWKEGKLTKETNNGRYISWDTSQHRWKTEHLVYDLNYTLPYSGSYSEYIKQKPRGYAKDYIDTHLSLDKNALCEECDAYSINCKWR